MPRGRPPTNPELKKLAGNPGKRPIKEPAKTKGKLAPPKSMTKDARFVWTEVLASMPEKSYGSADAFTLSVFCEAVADYWTAAKMCEVHGRYAAGSTGQMAIAPWATDKDKLSRTIYTYAQRLYLDPVARQSLLQMTPDNIEEDEFSGFIN
jgi:P27 family predicted phage terminase small subunit